MSRKGDWIQTYSGRQFWPLDPRVEEIHLIDIASGLAKDCRFGGHCLRFYSVAEHSVLMVRYLRDFWRSSPSLLRAALFHDASEGLGMRDMPRPLKASLPEYKAIELGIMCKVAERFDFEWPMSPIVKRADERIGLTEQAQNMAPPPAAWRTSDKFDATVPLPVTLQFWPPDQAMREFLDTARELGVAA